MHRFTVVAQFVLFFSKSASQSGAGSAFFEATNAELQVEGRKNGTYLILSNDRSSVVFCQPFTSINPSDSLVISIFVFSWAISHFWNLKENDVRPNKKQYTRRRWIIGTRTSKLNLKEAL